MASRSREKKAILNEYVIRLEAIGVDCPTATDSTHAEDRFREYLDARRKVVDAKEDQEKARCDFGSWYTENHPDAQEMLQEYKETIGKLCGELGLIGVDVPKLEDECDKQDMYTE